MLNKLDGRNGSGEFARRSLKNLDFILDAARNSADVHPVTHRERAARDPCVSLGAWRVERC